MRNSNGIVQWTRYEEFISQTPENLNHNFILYNFIKSES